jgi:uncharacterized protein (DUF58 family)
MNTFRRACYVCFRLLSGFQHRLRRRLTLLGGFLVGGIVTTAILGIDTNLAMAYQAFTGLLALLVAAVGATFFFRGRFRVERQLPRLGTIGMPLRYRVAVTNTSSQPQQGLSLHEMFADPRPDFATFRDTPEPGEARRNWVDRLFVFYRWRWLITRNTKGAAAETPLPPLAPGETAAVEVELTPQRRGVLRFTGAAIACPDPIGAVRALRRVAAADTLLVLPRRYRVPPLSLPGSQRYQQGGVALSSSIGESEEFIGLRDYRPGDPRRHIHWRSWARTGRPVVKEFEDEFFVRHALVLDTFRDDMDDDVFEEAVSVAASFACTVETQESLLDLLFVGHTAVTITVGRAVGQVDHLLEVLAGAEGAAGAFAELAALVTEHAPLVDGCALVLLRWDEERRELVRQLAAAGTAVEVFVVVAEDAPAIDWADTGVAADQLHTLHAGRIEQELAR